MANQNIGFNPIQCTSKIFEKLSPQEGYVYFVTDTKQLFLGKDGKFVDMCGGINLVYGEKDIEYDNSGLLPDPNVTFYLNELEEKEAPLINDLILNKDGCFYRVKSVNEDVIETTRLTLQGTGTGGGSTGPGGSIGGSYSIALSGGSSKVYSSTADKMEVAFTGYYNGTDNNYLSYVSFTIKGQDKPFYEDTNANILFNVEKTIDLIDYIGLFNSNKTTVTIAVEDKYGAQRSTNFTIEVVELAITATLADIFYSNKPQYTYSCNLSGGTSGVSNKKLIYNFYLEDRPNEPILTTESILTINDEGPIQKSLDFSSLNHGIYILEVIAQAQILGSTTLIKSNTLTHKVGYFEESIGNPLLIASLPSVTEQYTNIPLQYLLVSSEIDKNYTLKVDLDGIEKTQLNLISNTLSKYDLYFETTGTYTLTLTVLELGISYSTTMNINAYTGNLPVIDPTRDDLMLYLNPKGRSNEAIDRNDWQDYNGNYTAKIKDLYYSSVTGWQKDTDGSSYLQLASGGKLEIPGFKPFEFDPTKVNASNSNMGYGMTIELDFEVNGVVDYDAELIKCISTNQQESIQVGFSITGNNIKFYNSRLNGGDLGALTSLNLIEGKRTRLSFVIEPNTGIIDFPMCYTYFNGILSNAIIYDKSDSFKDSTDNPATFIADSTNGQIKIYGIRFYSSALSDRLILNNYTASLPTLEERQERYDTNNVYDANGNINYNLVSAEMYDLQIPYMTITGGYATSSEDKWKLKTANDIGKPGLPTGKKDYRLIDVEVRYPENSYFSGYKNFSSKCIFENGLPINQNAGNKPKSGACIMYAQGTSSMEYPIKNLRLRWKDEDLYYIVRPDLSPVEIICMKADYMESSGSHNTGAANLVDALYKGSNMTTPGQDHFGPTEEQPDRKTIVTCIKGHPCLIFYRATENDSYTYIGKYNLNLDKATPEPFGFNHDDSDFGYLPVGESYYENDEEKIVQEGEKINSIHCFEFLDNSVAVCNFLRTKPLIKDEDGNLIQDPNGKLYSYKETWYNTFINKDNERVPGWTLGFESRYPEDKVGYHDADALYPLASWLAELKIKYDEELAEGKKPTDIIYEYEYTLADEYEIDTEYYYQDDNGDWQLENNIDEDTFPETNTKYHTREIKSSTFVMTSLERFKREYQCYLDKEFLLAYYLITEALLMADNRVKNMMIATWGKDRRSYVDIKTNEVVETNNYIFYPIFYDMDTMLGLDNTGVNRFNYYDEDTDPKVYNGDEVLWNFVKDTLQDDLNLMYNRLENSLLNIDMEDDGVTYKGIIPYFNNNQANMANEAFYNGDAKYKYIDPARNGYYDGLNGKDIAPGEAPYLYAAQGDRTIDREYFIVNRIKFLRGKRNSNRYHSGDRIEFRWYAPTEKTEGTMTEEDLLLNASIKAVPPDGKFKFTSLQTCYSGVQLGPSSFINKRFDGEQTQELEMFGGSANGTEAYIFGISNLKDLGDLSNKYMQKFIMDKSDNKLQSLTLGNPHKDYHNPYWNPSATGGQSSKVSVEGCTYLQNFNLQNCKAYNNTLDFSTCPIIERVLLTGSKVSGITFPVNGMLKEVRLPNTVKTLSIDSHLGLTDSGFSLGTYDYGEGEKIGDPTGKYINDFSQLTGLSIINTPIDTYKMATQALSLQNYCFQDFTWTITENDIQYCKTKDESPVEGKTYYAWNNDENVKAYQPIDPADLESKWAFAKEKIELIQNGEVVAIPILDYLSEKSPVKNDIGITHAEALSGNIIINIEAKANEFYLYNKYHNIYPNVTITYGEKVELSEAYTINFYNIDTVSDTTEPYYSVLTDGTKTLAELTAATGPAGTALKDPVKLPTNTNTYEFSGEWIDKTTNEKYNVDDFETIIPKSNLNLIPNFRIYTRTYIVEFFDGDAQIQRIEYEYERLISSNPDAPLYYAKDDSNLEDYERYSFKGWIGEKDYINNNPNPVFYDLSATQVRQNLKLYAYFVVENVLEVPMDLKYFDIQNNSISIKEEYRDHLKGKITLPSVDESNNFITKIKDFQKTQITHVFFLPSAKYTEILDNGGFNSNYSLISIQLPNTVERIGSYAFANCSKLSEIPLSDNITYIGDRAFSGSSSLKLTKLPDNLETLGEAAFLSSGISLSKLPQNLSRLEYRAFWGSDGVNLSTFGHTENSILSAEDNKLTYIGDSALSGCGNEITEIFIKNSIKTLANSCFSDFGKTGSTLVVHDSSGILTESNLENYFGNSASRIELYQEV